MLLAEFASVPEISFSSVGKFVLFRFSVGDESRFILRADKGLSHTKISALLLSAVERKVIDGIRCQILGGGFIKKDDKRKIIILNGESEKLGPLSKSSLPHLLYLLEEAFPGYRIAYDNLVLEDE